MRKLAFCLLFLSILSVGFAKRESDAIPTAPNPPRLVNDFAGVLEYADIAAMERQLVDFNDSTSNVICVVTVNDLGNYSAAQFAYEIGDRWGVRSKDKRNGVVILIKPSTGKGDGDVYISVGYDLEGAIPDAIAKRIVEQKMIPELSEGHYQAAIDSALTYILPLASGEISASDLENEDSPLFILISILCIVVPILILIHISKKSGGHGNNHTGGSNDYGGRTIFMGPSPFGGYGGYGGFGGFDGSSGGGFGGFGGFGGSGGFGGGGAGGRF